MLAPSAFRQFEAAKMGKLKGFNFKLKIAGINCKLSFP